MMKTRRKEETMSKKVKASNRSKRGNHCLWSEAAMNAALDAVKSGNMTQRGACKTYNVPRCTLQVRLSGKTEVGARPGHPTRMSLQQEEKIVDYACNRAAMGIGFGRTQFLKYAENFSKKHNIAFKKGKPSFKWWRGMQKRHAKMTLRQPEGTAAIRHQCMDQVKVAKYFSVLRGVIYDNRLQDKPASIWNMDETGMQLDHKPGKIIAEKGVKYLHSRTSGNRETITVIGCVNAAGGCIPPHVIVKGKTKRSLFSFNTETAPAGSTWSVSDSGWTKQGIAFLWFKESFLPNIGTDRPQILILDGHDSHNFMELIDAAIENDIHIVELPAHTSNWLQPCDRTVFGPLKNAYRKACEDLSVNFPGTLVSRATFCGLLSKSWLEAVTSSNIQSGFRACGIHPFDVDSIPTEAYLPNSLYSVRSLVNNEDLLNGLNEDVEPSDNPTDHEQQLSTDPGTESTLVQPGPSSEVECVLSTSTPKRDESILEDISKFLTSDPQVLSCLCSAAPAGLALSIMESTLTSQQLDCFKYCFEKKFDLDKDEDFMTWKKLKVLAETSVPLDESLGCNPLDFSFNIQDAGTTLSDISVGELIPDCSTQIGSKSQNDKQTIKISNEGHSKDLENVGISSTVQHVSASADLSGSDENVSMGTENVVVKDPVSTVQSVSNLGNPYGADENLSIIPAQSEQCRINRSKFPFQNLSFPGDDDGDVLPYPKPIVRSKKTKVQQKFFLLTSAEARESKLKEVQAKEARQVKKEENALKRKKQQEEKATLISKKTTTKKETQKQSNQKKGNRKDGGLKSKVSLKNKNGCKMRKEDDDLKSKVSLKKKKECKMRKKDDTPCEICKVVYCEDQSGGNWINCQKCLFWFHNECQGLDKFEKPETFTCISCENDSNSD